MTITQDTNTITFVHSATEKELVPRAALTVRLLDSYVWLEYDQQGQHKKVKIDYTIVTEPAVASASELYDVLFDMINA